MQHRPYRRIIRPFPAEDNEPFPYDRENYIRDVDYSTGRIEAVRSCFTLQSDLIRLFEYIEPADENLGAFSIRLYELLLRACTEIEANSKAILTANGYQKSGNWNMDDYKKINSSSRLCDYEVEVNIWRQSTRIFRPFEKWAQNESLPWYQAYNNIKHNRHENFKQANLENAVNAIAGVVAILFSQFYVDALHTRKELDFYSYHGGFFSENDLIFGIKPSQEWTDEERYEFNWVSLENSSDKFQLYSF